MIVSFSGKVDEGERKKTKSEHILSTQRRRKSRLGSMESHPNEVNANHGRDYKEKTMEKTASPRCNTYIQTTALLHTAINPKEKE